MKETRSYWLCFLMERDDSTTSVIRLFFYKQNWLEFDELLDAINKDTGFNITHEELAKLRVLK